MCCFVYPVLMLTQSLVVYTRLFLLILPALLHSLLPVHSITIVLSFRELAYQIYKEYERFSKYFEGVKISVFFGGISIKKDEETIKNNCPHIVVGTPGRILALIRQKTLNLKNTKHFILDECDKMLEQLGELIKIIICNGVCSNWN